MSHMSRGRNPGGGTQIFQERRDPAARGRNPGVQGMRNPGVEGLGGTQAVKMWGAVTSMMWSRPSLPCRASTAQMSRPPKSSEQASTQRRYLGAGLSRGGAGHTPSQAPSPRDTLTATNPARGLKLHPRPAHITGKGPTYLRVGPNYPGTDSAHTMDGPAHLAVQPAHTSERPHPPSGSPCPQLKGTPSTLGRPCQNISRPHPLITRLPPSSTVIAVSAQLETGPTPPDNGDSWGMPTQEALPPHRSDTAICSSMAEPVLVFQFPDTDVRLGRLGVTGGCQEGTGGRY